MNGGLLSEGRGYFPDYTVFCIWRVMLICWTIDKTTNIAFSYIMFPTLRFQKLLFKPIKAIFPSRVRGRGYGIGPVCVCVCLSVSALTAQRFEVRTQNLVDVCTLIISRMSSKVKVIGQRSRSSCWKTWIFDTSDGMAHVDSLSWHKMSCDVTPWRHDVTWRHNVTWCHTVTSWREHHTISTLLSVIITCCNVWNVCVRRSMGQEYWQGYVAGGHGNAQAFSSDMPLACSILVSYLYSGSYL